MSKQGIRYSILAFILALAGVMLVINMNRADSETAAGDSTDIKETKSYMVKKTDQQWREELTEEQYRITREKGTERAFTGEYYKNEDTGVYLCVCCGNELFSSETKYESGSGWPSYWAPIDSANVEEITDSSLGMARTEVTCSKCGAHLGHVFDDGPQPTGQRFCVNSASLKFKKAEK